MRLENDVQRQLDEGRPDLAWDVATRAWREGTPRERFYARRLLGAVVSQVADAAWTSERAVTARDSGIDRRRPSAIVGRVAFPVVGQGRAGRFVAVDVRLDDGDALPAGVSEPARSAAAGALEAARRLVPGCHFRVDVQGTVDWNGTSWGLAVGLAAVSAAKVVALSDGVLATGELAADGRVLDVGHRQAKVQLLREARPRGRMLVPSGWEDVQRPGVRRCLSLDDAWGHIAPAGRDLDASLEHVRRLEREGRWSDAAVEAEVLLDEDLEDAERGELLVLLQVAANHLADAVAQRRWCEALARLGDVDLDEVFVARALCNRVVHCVDRLDVAAAKALVEEASDRSWGRAARVHLRGAEALVRTLTGDHQGALTLRKANVADAAVAERARCLGDLSDAWLRLGEAQRALDVVGDAQRLSEEVRRRRGYQVLTRSYLVLHEARALGALGRVGDALEVLRQAPGAAGLDPQLRWRLLEAELRGDLGLLEARWSAVGVLADAVILCALFERSRARLGDDEGRNRLLAHDAFAGLSLEEAARRLPY